MSIIPAWYCAIPDRSDPKYFNWLVTKAAKDGVPDHVIERLVYKYFSLPIPDGYAMFGNNIELYYETSETARLVYDKLEGFFVNE